MQPQLNHSMETSVILYGASGHCKVIIDILQVSNIKIKTILDDNLATTSILENKVEYSQNFELKNLDKVILSIGNNKVRKLLSNKLKVNFVTAIHPKAIISNYSKIEKGTVIMAGAIVNPNAQIGKHCIINTGAIVEHDCIIQDFSHISPNASLAGGVEVGEGSQIGIGAVVIQGIKIGKWAVIGAGAVIINHIPDYAIVVGNPGKIIKYNEQNE